MGSSAASQKPTLLLDVSTVSRVQGNGDEMMLTWPWVDRQHATNLLDRPARPAEGDPDQSTDLIPSGDFAVVAADA
ncbi:hypothetical protein IAQ61_002161 [Plenodomus lingam]|uniref:uncharacterized protein n=1 Tax=Leptosphaeria maculans TaxID=5022 RepID=UPI00332DA698|nr:hypothetical protein IAQ61_002161 [Plenodomus lingam]